MSNQNQDTRPVYMGTYDRDKKTNNLKIAALQNDLANIVKLLYRTKILSIAAFGFSLLAISIQLFLLMN